MLLDGPLEHLVDGKEHENVTAENLGLNRENGPNTGLPEVVGTGDQSEAPPFGNSAGCRSRLAQAHQRNVAHEVHEFADTEDGEAGVVESGGGPGWRRVLGRHVEVHAEDAEENVVVERVFEDVEERHGVGAKPMHEDRLQFALDVVQNDHQGANLLADHQRGV